MGKKKLKLDQLIEKHKGKILTIVLSHFQGKRIVLSLYYLIKNYGIKPLVVRFNHGFMRNVVYENNQNTFKKLGVDVIDFTPNWKIVKLLIEEVF